MVKISADSTCDLSKDILEQLDISIAPLHILMDEESYQDGENISPNDIFRHVEAGKICRTAAVNIFEYEAFFKRLTEQHDAVVHICISSELSSCYQNATLASEAFDHVYVIDSKSLATGSGQLAYQAALMAQEGQSAEVICETLKAMVPRVDASFMIDCLDYLQRGGRCSALTAQSTKLLQLKPCIELVNGKMTVGKKYQGSLEKCLTRYVRDHLKNRDDLSLERIFITHSCAPEVVDAVEAAIQKYANFKQIIRTNAGCTVSNHCGPNTLGIFFMRK